MAANAIGLAGMRRCFCGSVSCRRCKNMLRAALSVISATSVWNSSHSASSSHDVGWAASERPRPPRLGCDLCRFAAVEAEQRPQPPQAAEQPSWLVGRRRVRPWRRRRPCAWVAYARNESLFRQVIHDAERCFKRLDALRGSARAAHQPATQRRTCPHATPHTGRP